jgi:release factor glutamine methyltransferase
MTIRSAQQQLRMQLTTLYELREADTITGWAMDHITGLQKTGRLLISEQELRPEWQAELNRITRELLNHRPVQYVLGEAWFAGMRFFVNEHVLIPRPETEELVQWLLDAVPASEGSVQVLDIGTGSGCIPITLKHKKPALKISAIDVSQAALTVARSNAVALGGEIDWLAIDFLDEKNWQQLPLFDIIISNPPYVKESESGQMARHVLDYEPALALFVPDEDALLFYRKIALFGAAHLVNGGMIFLEINESLGRGVIELLAGLGYGTESRKDLQGRDRMIRAWKNL